MLFLQEKEKRVNNRDQSQTSHALPSTYTNGVFMFIKNDICLFASDEVGC